MSMPPPRADPRGDERGLVVSFCLMLLRTVFLREAGCVLTDLLGDCFDRRRLAWLAKGAHMMRDDSSSSLVCVIVKEKGEPHHV